MIRDILIDIIQRRITFAVRPRLRVFLDKRVIHSDLLFGGTELLVHALYKALDCLYLCCGISSPQNGRGLPQLARLRQLNGNIAQNLSGAVYIPVSGKLICNHAGQRNHLWRQLPPRLRLSDGLFQGGPGAFKSGIENLLRFRKRFLVPKPEIRLRVLLKALPDLRVHILIGRNIAGKAPLRITCKASCGSANGVCGVR